jgi:CheY-like chemotaxis protein
MSEWRPAQTPGQHTILYVEDEPVVQALWTELIEIAGYRVLTACDGAAAVQLFSTEIVHAVILDYEMPGMNGAAVAAQMRKIDDAVPLILHSGGSSTITQEELLLFNCFISKSNPLSVLLNAIKGVLAVNEA